MAESVARTLCEFICRCIESIALPVLRFYFIVKPHVWCFAAELEASTMFDFECTYVELLMLFVVHLFQFLSEYDALFAIKCFQGIVGLLLAAFWTEGAHWIGGVESATTKALGFHEIGFVRFVGRAKRGVRWA